MLSYLLLTLESVYSRRYEYELIGSKGNSSISNDSTFDFQLPVGGPPISLNLDFLGQSIKYPTNFTFGIRIKTSSGHRSTLNQTQIIEIQPPAVKSFFYIGIVIVIASSLFVLSLVIFAIRNVCVRRWTVENYELNDAASVKWLNDDSSLVAN